MGKDGCRVLLFSQDLGRRKSLPAIILPGNEKEFPFVVTPSHPKTPPHLELWHHPTWVTWLPMGSGVPAWWPQGRLRRIRRWRGWAGQQLYYCHISYWAGQDYCLLACCIDTTVKRQSCQLRTMHFFLQRSVLVDYPVKRGLRESKAVQQTNPFLALRWSLDTKYMWHFGQTLLILKSCNREFTEAIYIQYKYLASQTVQCTLQNTKHKKSSF